MKQILSFLIGGILLLHVISCVSTQAFSKASYISRETVFIKSDKIPDLAIIAVYNDNDRATYEAITNQLQSLLKTKNINSDVSFFSKNDPAENFITKMKGNFQLTIYPIKDEYVKDELNNPVLSKQIVVTLTRYSAQKLAEIVIAIDRIEKPDKLGNQIAGLVCNYLRNKNFSACVGLLPV